MEVNLSKWYVLNTGLIITHPFLNQLFNKLQYLNIEGKFKYDDLKYRAVYLLHYLATESNDETIEESYLAIPKVLCGMEIHEPVPYYIKLYNEEKEIAEELLTVILNNWNKLEQTSTEELRNTFLIRDGLLQKQEGAYQLTVQSSGYDILLDLLPWHINIIKLAWLYNIIYVSWR
ncbi:contractile injection system tape measure protein [Mariniflexile sp. AS56]|uniref:contractile injection system tape measure protein n=1 Tax=Mariniflexile sp. AS56 TaxID=3063957 RepID=UPI0026F2F0F5|nr:contractile injection system tape measure protein [Mariniflexile sp. AS56]MDO7173700.1 contractile injection system tape measure protein [Mariniflexile sp. AS56]